MLKKLLTILAALLALALCAGAACGETGEVWVQEGRLAAQADGTVLLHLMIGKAGGPVRLDNVSVVFLNEAGGTVPMASVALEGAAVLALEEGEHRIPVTLAARPAAGAAAVADFRVTGLYTSAPEAGEAPQIAPADGLFLMEGPAQDELTAFTDAWAGAEPAAYSGYAFVYDRAGAYLGNVFLPQGSGAFVPGEGMLTALAQAIRWEEKELRQAGFPESAPDCILFGAVPMSGLPQGVAPGGAEVFVCAAQAEEQTLAIVGFTLEAEAGRFTIHASAQNISAVAVRLTGVPYVAMHDAAGSVRLVTDVTLMMEEAVFAPGEIREFNLTGPLEEGFVPEACGFVTECEPVT